jgi:hypothetical protein
MSQGLDPGRLVSGSPKYSFRPLTVGCPFLLGDAAIVQGVVAVSSKLFIVKRR